MKIFYSVLFLPLLLTACDSSTDPGEEGPVRLSCPGPLLDPPRNAQLENSFPLNDFNVTVNAAVSGAKLNPVWGDHYDLSYHHLRYGAEAGFNQVVQDLQVRSWRVSVGRWEVGTPPPAGATSDDAQTLINVEREYYRGANSLAEADDLSNYDFSYLDAQLDALTQLGVEPFVSFDYMPFTLAKIQDTNNAYNIAKTDSQYSFSNGIRTSAPQDAAVYARVVYHTIKHIMQRYPNIEYFEIGNEPEFTFFWSGSRQEWIDMYLAIAAEVQADGSLSQIKLGGGSFALPVASIDDELGGGQLTFMHAFLQAAGAARLDFVSFHAYSDLFSQHFKIMSYARDLVDNNVPQAELINGEWGLDLGGGLDSVYDHLDHGLFRTKVMMAMQIFDVRIAHESLMRDLYPQDCLAGQLGLIYTGPAQGKAAYRVYQGLNDFNQHLNALVTSTANGSFVMAGINDNQDSVLVTLIVEELLAGPRTVTFDLLQLPWGATGQYTVYGITQDQPQRQIIDQGSITQVSPSIAVTVDKAQMLLLKFSAN